MAVLHIYTRVSSDSQEENTSLATQYELGKQLAERLGFQARLWNEGVASSKDEEIERRPVLVELMNAVKEGLIEHLYVVYQDRLSRNNLAWSLICHQLQKKNVKLYKGTDTTPTDFNDPTSALLANLLAGFATFDNALRSSRLKMGRFSRVGQGYWHGGPAPFGYKLVDKKLAVEESEAKWVRYIFTRFCETKSVDRIRTELMSQGVKTRRKKIAWSYATINKLLTNTHFTGSYLVEDKSTGNSYKCNCPRIVEDDLFQKVQNLISQRSYESRIANPNQKHHYLLDGVMFCGSCGKRMSGKIVNSQKRRTYSCVSKSFNHRRADAEKVHCQNSRSINLDRADELVWSSISKILKDSHIFKEEIKRQRLQTGSYADSVEEEKKIKYKMTKLKREVKVMDDVIKSLNAALKYDEDIDKKSRTILEIKDRESTRDYLHESLQSLDDERARLVKQRRWNDWVAHHGELVESLGTLSDVHKRKEFVDHVVERIEVSTTSISPVEHDVKIVLRLPYLNDGFRWRDNSNRRLGYELLDGQKELSILVAKESKKATKNTVLLK